MKIPESIDRMSKNAKLVRSIILQEDPKRIHSDLDRLINTVDILYKTKKDFLENFPKDDDIYGKANLIITRRLR